MRSLQGGEHRLTKLGKGFFRDKYYEYLVHVPVIIRGRRRSGRNADVKFLLLGDFPGSCWTPRRPSRTGSTAPPGAPA